MSDLRLVVVGVAGRMGQTVVRTLTATPGLPGRWPIDAAGRPWLESPDALTELAQDHPETVLS